MSIQFWVFAAFCLPILGFAAFSFTKTPSSPGTEGKVFFDDFLVASRESSAADVGASTVAYMLQISTTFYFVFWGFRYGLSNIAYVISWAIGIWLFSRMASRLLVVRDSHETLAAFLASQGGKSLRRCIGLVIALFFLGLVYVESFFAADFLSSLFVESTALPKATLWWIFFSLLVLSVASYSFIGGMRKVIATDKLQLAMAYIGFAIVFSYLIPAAIERHLGTGLLVWLLAMLIYGTIYYRMQRERAGVVIRRALQFCLFILFLSAILARPWESQHSLFGALQIAGPFKQVSEPWGFVALAGFTVANILWQFGDSSNFQRLACVSLSGCASEDDKISKIEKLLTDVTIVAPLTWGFGILLGMLLAASGVIEPTQGEEYATFLRKVAVDMTTGDLKVVGIAIALGMSISVVMLSTADSSLLAYLQATIQDVDSVRSDAGVLTIATYGLVAVLFLFASALFHKYFGNVHIFTVLGMFNAFVIVIAVPSLLALFDRPMSSAGVWSTVVLGCGLVVLATYGPVSALPFNVQVVLPFFGALGGSLLGFAISRVNS